MNSELQLLVDDVALVPSVPDLPVEPLIACPAPATSIPTGASSPPFSSATPRTRLGPTSATSRPGTPGARHRAFIRWPPDVTTSTPGSATSAKSPRTARAVGKHPRAIASPIFTSGSPSRHEPDYTDLVLGLVVRWAAIPVTA